MQEQLTLEAVLEQSCPHPADVGMPAAVQGGAAIFNAEEVREREAQRELDAELDRRQRAGYYGQEEQARILAAEAQEPAVWEMSASMYQARAGVHAPHIGEISPTQYNRMSGRSRRAYDAKRHQEWQASADCKSGWRALVVAAHDAGEFHYSDPGVHREAKSAVLGAQIERKKQETAERFTEARKANQITGPEDVEIGQRVHSLMVGYGIVIKKNAKSCRLRVRFAWGEESVKCGYRELEHLHYNELKAKVEAEEVSA